MQSLVKMEMLGEHSSEAKGIATLINPPYALIKFFSYIIYYTASRNEEFYADLKAVEWTRYPAGMYSLLSKLESAEGTSARMPEKYGYLYFMNENSKFEQIPLPQPTLEERKTALQLIDLTLSSSAKLGKNLYCCPQCKGQLEPVMLKSHHGNFIKNYHCKNCDGYWMGGWNLFMISELENGGLAQEKKNIRESTTQPINEMQCPICGSKLAPIRDKNPLLAKAWECPGCKGNWISGEAFKELLVERSKIKEKNEIKTAGVKL
jgi:uncharacterized protein with PIN domain